VLFFLPLGTTRPHWRVPFATLGLLAINVAVYFIGPSPEGWGFIPGEATVRTWFASIFLHASLAHLLANMLFLWLFGSIAEDVLGPWLFLAFYFGGSVGATSLDTIVSTAFLPASLNLPRVGASGAIAGIMGLSALCFTHMRVRVWYFAFYFIYLRTGTVMIGAPAFIALWVAWEIVRGLISTYMVAAFGGLLGVAHWAHVGGFIFGFAVALGLGLRKRVARTDLVSGRRPVTDSFEAYSQLGELERLVHASPEDAQACYALGRAQEVNGRTEEARKAYTQAMILFLRQRKMKEAVRAYRAIGTFSALLSCPDDVQFELARAFEESGHAKEAFEVFLQVAEHSPGQPQAEIALFRAGEIARTSLGDRDRAGKCYESLLKDYPNTHWRNLCLERMRQLGIRQESAGGDDK